MGKWEFPPGPFKYFFFGPLIVAAAILYLIWPLSAADRFSTDWLWANRIALVVVVGMLGIALIFRPRRNP